MNEKEFYQDTEAPEEQLDDVAVLSDPDSGFSRNDISTVSSGDSQQSIDGVTGELSDSFEGDSEVVLLDLDYDQFTSAIIRIEEYNQEILEEVKSINVIALLIFLYLILSWTERKISAAVNRISSKPRKRV